MPRKIKWSESIIVLGKGLPSWSQTYGCLTYCIAGIGKLSGWLRLYPIFKDVEGISKPIEKFDVIKTIFREKRPERYRPESRKIYPEHIEKINCINEPHERKKILKKFSELGNFLHDDSWRGRKTLGIIKPISPNFYVTKENIAKVRFRCTSATCSGHTNDVEELIPVDSVGRKCKIGERTLNTINEKLSDFKGKDLWFVLGTHSYHPQRWLLIAIHAFEKHIKDG